jgi:hypothetical protein
MKNISLKMDDQIFNETEGILARIKKSRNRYINEAIDYYNKVQKRRILKKLLEDESALVKEDSMTILKEFESLDHED